MLVHHKTETTSTLKTAYKTKCLLLVISDTESNEAGGESGGATKHALGRPPFPPTNIVTASNVAPPVPAHDQLESS